MVSAAGRSERESAAKALICADMSSIPGSFREAARSVSRAFRSFASSSIPAALVVRTRTLMSSSRARQASEKDDVAESRARLLGSRSSAIRLIWVAEGADPCGTRASPFLTHDTLVPWGL